MCPFPSFFLPNMKTIDGVQPRQAVNGPRGSSVHGTRLSFEGACNV